MSLCNLRVRSDVLTLRAYCLRTILALATLFSVGCAGTRMASTSPSSTTPAGSLSLSNSTLNFGNVQLGSAKSMSLALTNAGTSAAVQISQVIVSGPGFTVTGVTLPVSLAAGQSVTLSVDFKPTSPGSTSGSVSIASTATNANISVGLSGAGLASGQLAVSPTSMSFSGVTVGGSQNQTGTLTAGSSSITVSSASWNGSGFSLSGISFPVTIPAGQSVPFMVTFAPQTAGTVNGTVVFVSNASNSPTNETWGGTSVQATPHSVDLSWNPDASTVQGYYVYRGAQTGGPYTRVSTLQPGTSYVDGSVLFGQTYYYVVTALGTNSQESTYSNEAVAVIP
jgi:Cep192 domain 4/Abnormal spindle-like microcephaly-assoc'd, ASPM-SPD-2-Hydin